MAGPAVTIRNLDQFKAQISAMGSKWPQGMAEVSKTIAEEGASRSRAAASGGTRQQARAAGAITGRPSGKTASIGVSGGPGYATAAFFGAKRHTGWYAKHRYYESKGDQFPPWVGSSWAAAVAGQGPYCINPALAEYVPEMLKAYQEMITRIAGGAFK